MVKTLHKACIGNWVVKLNQNDICGKIEIEVLYIIFLHQGLHILSFSLLRNSNFDLLI